MVDYGLETFKVFLGKCKDQTVKTIAADQFIVGSVFPQVALEHDVLIIANYKAKGEAFVHCKEGKGA